MKSNNNDSKLIWEGMMSTLGKIADPLGVNPIIGKATSETTGQMASFAAKKLAEDDNVMGDDFQRFEKGDFVQFVGDDGLKLVGRVVVHLPATPDKLMKAPNGWVGIDRTGNGSPDMIVKADNVKLVPSVDTSEHDPEASASRGHKDEEAPKMSDADWEKHPNNRPGAIGGDEDSDPEDDWSRA